MQLMPEPTIARIERALAFMNYVVDHYGERYAPVRDSLIVDLEAYRRRQPSPETRMLKRPRPLLDRSEVDDDTPLHLETAARLAFPDGVVSGLALRNAASRGDLEYERLGGRIVTTLRWIREWRERNRRPALLTAAKLISDERSAAATANAYRVLADLHAKSKERTPSEAHQAASAALEARRRALPKPKPDKGSKPQGNRIRRPKE